MQTHPSLSFVDLGEELTPLQATTWVGLLATHSSITRQLDAMLRASHQLGLSAYEVLLRLARAPACRLRMTELAATAPLTLSGISRMVGRLERDGLVRREGSAEDGRVACATLTKDGVARLRAAHQTYLDGVRRLFLAHFSEPEMETLNGYWQRLSGSP
ncbi:MAG: MarR family winged helix-turn-helix transcriptional regulator [Ktedonobacterales bacterium]|jgi:DNA-binding MarR family transcriptional regulator